MLLIEPVIEPILQRLIAPHEGQCDAVITDSDDAGLFAVWCWTVPIGDGELAVQLHFQQREDVITSLRVLYCGPVIGAAQLMLASRVRNEVEGRTGVYTEADWKLTKRKQGLPALSG